MLIIALLGALLWFAPQGYERLQSAWFDTYQVLIPRSVEDTRVTVVEIDDESLTALGQWPWPRTVLAELVRAIARHHPAAIGIDIVMPEADRLSPQQLARRIREYEPALASRVAALPSNDAALASALAAAPVVLALAADTGVSGGVVRAAPFTVIDTDRDANVTSPSTLNVPKYGGVLTSIDEIDRAAAGHGLMTIETSRGVIRRMPLVFDIGGTLAPAFAVEILRVAFAAPELRLTAMGSSVRSVSVGPLVAPTDERGRIPIYYSRREPHRYVSAIDVLIGKVDPLLLRDKLVLVGATGIGLGDYHATPLGQFVPGAEIHAQVLENLYDHTWLARPPWAPATELGGFLLLGALLLWATPRWKPRNAAVLALVCIAVPALFAFLAFRERRQLFDAATPGLALMLLFSTLLMLTLAEATRRRRALEQTIQAQREHAAYIAGELMAAQRIQTGILPRADLLRDERRIELAATMIPAREVGGDLYDFFMLDDRRLFFSIGDVAGKGLSASIFMAVSKALYKSTALRTRDATIDWLMRTANEEVARDNSEMFFVTAFAGILDLESGDLAYCNAGHENPYLLDPSQGRFVRLEDGAGPPLCAVDGYPYRDATLRMRRGELLCLITDGVLDARNPAGDRYGRERLEGVLARFSGGEESARKLVSALSDDVRAFAGVAEPADDVTVLALRWLG